MSDYLYFRLYVNVRLSVFLFVSLSDSVSPGAQTHWPLLFFSLTTQLAPAAHMGLIWTQLNRLPSHFLSVAEIFQLLEILNDLTYDLYTLPWT